MSKHPVQVEILDEDFEFTLIDLCQSCTAQEEQIIEMVEEGMLIPIGNSPSNWRFSGISHRHVEIALHLQRDLRVNLPGAALVIELLDEIEGLHRELVRKG
jgi:chaperone modulatory protein CbpM